MALDQHSKLERVQNVEFIGIPHNNFHLRHAATVRLDENLIVDLVNYQAKGFTRSSEGLGALRGIGVARHVLAFVPLMKHLALPVLASAP